jgi:hypothetical protein
MRIVDTAKLVVGSCVVYLVVGACAAAYDEQGKNMPPPTENGTSSSGAPTPSTPGPSPTNPVPNAMADGFRSGTRLKLRFHEGEDGSRQFIDFFDTKYQTNCTVGESQKTIEGKTRCLPLRVGTMYFSDAQCKSPVVYTVNKAQVQPKIGVMIVYGASFAYQEHYSLQGLVNPPATGYTLSPIGGQCSNSQSTIPAGDNYYAVGTPLAPTEFVEMTIKNE